ncbi:chromatin assembly factor 1, p105 subunit [Oratosquilla oratoria]|uniref:chromatin assembly factor 1, p105 subunit n=1 Tax=Oratosquilla oratoria TaxID=337810 RepID=UPI003F7612A8
MKCTIPEISWHNRDPVYTVDIQWNSPDGIYRLASGGTDTHVVIWQLQILDNGGIKVEPLSDLTRHSKAVNAVRFSPNGEYLASVDDEAAIIIWKKQDLGNDIFTDEAEKENKEHWTVHKMLRGHLEDIYDVCWSKCSQYLITGSVDNSAIMWDVVKGKNIGILKDHKGFVQGVAWDPLGQYVATMSSDRIFRLYSISTKKLVSKVHKGSVCIPDQDGNITEKTTHLFHDDTLKSFSRRLCFSPDGEVILVPSGIIEIENDKTTHVTYVFSRHCPSKPVMFLPSNDKYAIASKYCPILFELKPLPKEYDEESEETEEPWQRYANLFNLPYRMVCAIATENAVLFYDTQQPIPFAKISNFHYTRLSDLAWSDDGRILVVSSTDGYCSLISFAEGELGTPYKAKTSECPTEKVIKLTKSTPDEKQEESRLPQEVNSESSSAATAKSETVVAKPIAVKRINENKQGKRVQLITLSRTVSVKDENHLESGTLNHRTQTTVSSEGDKKVASMEVDSGTAQEFEDAHNSPVKVMPKEDSSANSLVSSTVSNKTPRRVPLITLSSPKSKKFGNTDSR